MAIQAVGFVAERGGTIFGVGSTAREALRDAREWVDDGDVSGLVAKPATQAALNRAKGGATQSGFVWTRADGVVTTYTEDAADGE